MLNPSMMPIVVLPVTVRLDPRGRTMIGQEGLHGRILEIGRSMGWNRAVLQSFDIGERRPRDAPLSLRYVPADVLLAPEIVHGVRKNSDYKNILEWLDWNGTTWYSGEQAHAESIDYYGQKVSRFSELMRAAESQTQDLIRKNRRWQRGSSRSYHG